mmetsp:Transcript_19229/g.32311  ORF Transcript_19229/g.32311 Transcript_19229/m.32311 type:complete len:232 (+) Transcript_19229:322-1017(+)
MRRVEHLVLLVVRELPDLIHVSHHQRVGHLELFLVAEIDAFDRGEDAGARVVAKYPAVPSSGVEMLHVGMVNAETEQRLVDHRCPVLQRLNVPWHVGAVLRFIVDQKLPGRVGRPREKAGVGPKRVEIFVREHFRDALLEGTVGNVLHIGVHQSLPYPHHRRVVLQPDALTQHEGRRDVVAIVHQRAHVRVQRPAVGTPPLHLHVIVEDDRRVSMRVSGLNDLVRLLARSP